MAAVIPPQLLETFLSCFFSPASFPQGCQSEVRFYGNGSSGNSLQMARERRWMPSPCWERWGTCGDEAEASDFAVKDTVTSLASAESVTDAAFAPSHVVLFIINSYLLKFFFFFYNLFNQHARTVLTPRGDCDRFTDAVHPWARRLLQSDEFNEKSFKHCMHSDWPREIMWGIRMWN